MSTEPDAEKLRSFYASFRCHGVVALIDRLATPEAKDLLYVEGFTSDLHEVAMQRFLPEKDRAAPADLPLGGVEIGSRDGSVTPLQWLENLALRFGELPPANRTQFDEICSNLAFVPGNGVRVYDL